MNRNTLQAPAASSQTTKRRVQQELIDMGIQPNTIIDKDELFVILDRKIGGQTFDRGVANQLYEQIDKDPQGRFTLNDFLDIFLEAERILREKLLEVEQLIAQDQKQRLEAQEQLVRIRKEEKLNSYGIMNDSVLALQNIEVTNLPQAQNREIFVRITCENNTYQTERRSYRQTARWDEQFKAEIKTGIDDLQIIIYAYGGGNEDLNEVLGGVGIPISRLRDQRQHEEWFDLYDQNGEQTGGRIYASLLWIHSRVLYITDLIKSWDAQISLSEEDKTDYNRDLNILYEAFPSVVGRKSVSPSPVKSRGTEQPTERNFSRLENRESPTKAYPIKHAAKEVTIAWKGNSIWGLLAFYSSIALIILGLFGCFVKASFVDVLLGISFLVSFNHKLEFFGSANRVLFFVIGTLMALIIDMFWFGSFASRWHNLAGSWDQSQDELDFVLVIRGFSFVVKIILLFCHIFFYRFLSVYVKNQSLHETEQPVVSYREML